MKLFNIVPKKLIAALVTVAAIAGIGAGVMAGFGPDRATFTTENPAQYITFNSITNNPQIGDERAFAAGALAGATSYSDPVLNAKNGDEVTVRAFVHNNAEAKLNLVAENVSIKVELPAGLQQVHQVKTIVSATNSNPLNVFDTVDISSVDGDRTELEFVPGSARLQNDAFPNGTQLSDSIATTGATLGYDQLNGRVPGCFEFAGYVTFKVKVKTPHNTIVKTARKSGEGASDWRKSVNAVPGDKIDYRIEFLNDGFTEVKQVRVYDDLPSYMRVVPGTVKMINANYPAPAGFLFPDTAISADGNKVDVNIGDYIPQTNAFVRFQAEFVNDPAIQCGTVKFTNYAYAQPNGMQAINDGADVYLVNSSVCQPTVAKQCTGLVASSAKVFVGQPITFTATAAVTNAMVAGYNFVANDAQGKLVDSFGLATSALTGEWTKTFTTPGTYKISVTINTDKGQAEGTCETTVTVEEMPATPIYACNSIMIDVLGNRKARVTVNTTGLPANRVSIKNFEYNYGNGTTPFVSDKNTAEYTYDKDGTYNVSVKVTFSVDGVDKTVSEGCAKVVTITTDEKCELNPSLPKGDSKCKEKCVYNSAIFKDDAKCKPAIIPNTGPTSMVSMFIVSSMLGMFLYRFAAIRRS